MGRTGPTPTMQPSMDVLINVSHIKLNQIDAKLATSSRENSDSLRRTALISNALDWSILEKQKEKKRKSEESLFARHLKSNKSSSPFIPTLGPTREEHSVIVEPYGFSQMIEHYGTIEEEEGEEAWFEKTWSELQEQSSDTSSDVSATSDISIEAPPTPKLKPTLLGDKMDGAPAFGTLAPSLECGIPIDQLFDLYEVLDEDTEADLDSSIEAIESLALDHLDGMDSEPDLDVHSDIQEGSGDELSEDEDDSQLPITPSEETLAEFSPSSSFDDDYQIHHYMQAYKPKGQFPVIQATTTSALDKAMEKWLACVDPGDVKAEPEALPYMEHQAVSSDMSSEMGVWTWPKDCRDAILNRREKIPNVVHS